MIDLDALYGDKVEERQKALRMKFSDDLNKNTPEMQIKREQIADKLIKATQKFVEEKSPE